MNKILQPCCGQWAKAHESGTDNEMYSSLAHSMGSETYIGNSGELESVKFCPWCGHPKGVPTPELTGTSPLVLYFGTEADRQEMIAAIREAKPGMITKHL